MIYAAITAIVFVYIIIRLVFGDPGITRLAVYSDNGKIADDVMAFIIQNKDNPQYISNEVIKMFPTLSSVVVKNRKNGVLEIRLHHKKIVAVWDSGIGFHPLTEDGLPIKQGIQKPSSGVIIIKGGVPPFDMGEITSVLNANPDILEKTEYLEYIENRRWNIKLKGGGLVMLSEQNIAAAVKEAKEIIGKSFKILDLRDSKRKLVNINGK